MRRYEASTAWRADVGLPAKSGVSGAVWAVVEGAGALAVHQPRLDEHGNSVQGMAFVREFASQVHTAVHADPCCWCPK